MIGAFFMVTGGPSTEGAPPEIASGDDPTELRREIARLREERDHLVAHTRNLEAQLRAAARDPARIRELEQRLAHAEALLRHVSFVRMARWIVLQPDAALRRIFGRLNDGPLWLVRDRYRRLRLRQRASKA